MVEGKTVISVHREAEKELTLDFEDLLFFFTGSRYLPTVGTVTGKLNFKHQNIKQGERVTVSTCAYSLLFPVTQRLLIQDTSYTRYTTKSKLISKI